MNRRGQVGLLFASISPGKHPTTLPLPLLAAMLFRQSENRQGQDSYPAKTKTWETFSSAAVHTIDFKEVKWRGRRDSNSRPPA